MSSIHLLAPMLDYLIWCSTNIIAVVRFAFSSLTACTLILINYYTTSGYYISPIPSYIHNLILIRHAIVLST
jgi:hypothetical protein